MAHSTLLCIAAAAAMVISLLPSERWQFWQLRVLCGLLSLARVLIVALGILFSFQPHYAPDAVVQALDQPTTSQAVAMTHPEAIETKAARAPTLSAGK